MSAPKAARSRLARKTLTHTIPQVLKSSSRAKSGVEHVQLLRDQDLKPRTSDIDALPPKVRVVATDTLQAAYSVIERARAAGDEGRVAILSMASELRPGGGFLNGANSQEESLCMRTTLYASLRDEFYRLPELGCIYTPDVCVFRGHYNDVPTNTITETNAAKEWWFVDVVSCAAIRSPEVDHAGKYASLQQKDLMREKIKRILRAAAVKGCRRIVLGAFGCGTFGNPSGEVAGLFHRVLMGRDGSGTGARGGEFVGCFDEVVFAIIGGTRGTMEAFNSFFQAT